MRGAAIAIVLAGLIVACGKPEPFPQPAALSSDAQADPGFPSAASVPLPLDEAVRADAPNKVRALLEAHADPNKRWSDHGDRFPLQEAIEARSYGTPTAHRPQIVRLLLEHGADPNARWCPFESRSVDAVKGCTSSAGVTPLMMAAALDDADITLMLLNAGADYRLEDSYHRNALDVARGEKLLYLLLTSMFPDSATRSARALSYINERHSNEPFPRWWEPTALMAAIAGVGGHWMPPRPASPYAVRAHRDFVGPSFQADRVKVLLALGADPNQRPATGVDWTPLAVAIAVHGADLVETLIAYGADVNAGWCTPLDFNPENRQRAANACGKEAMITPLMYASSLGDERIAKLLRRQP